MALVTVSRSPPASGHATPVGPTDQASARRGQLQRRQSFAVLHGAVLGLQDGGGSADAAEARLGPKEEPPGEEEPAGDRTDQGLGPPSLGKQDPRRHLHLMVGLLRPQDDIRLAAQLEAARPPRLRYLLVVSTRDLLSQDETVLLGVDLPDGSSPSCTLGLVLPLWSDTQVYLDGDGGFSVTSGGQSRIFKPISIQTMWATLQVLHQACEAALGSGLVPGGSALTWASHYQDRLSSDQSCLNEWMAMADLESLRPPGTEPGRPSEQEQMEQAIRAGLWEVLDTSDLGTRVLVHCKMGVSRSAATVAAYAMKQYGWSLERALRHVQELRPIARPNPGFLRQLQTYQGILTASRQSQVWEQKVGGASPEEPLALEASKLLPPLLPEPGDSEGVKAMGLEESQSAPKEEPGPRPRINLRGVMRSISLLEPPSGLESALEASDLPEVFSSSESSEENPPQSCPQPSKAKGQKGPWPALKSHQSVAALNSAALVASRAKAFQEPEQEQEQEQEQAGAAGGSSVARTQKVVRQASIDGSGEEGEA
ncbi:PREDICTED: protein phosphatase Slingshot homolog 3 [Condylura cristata]|uniref:protein phosphatase Slingshot homolog 3 n=1 Tax=Condylura cristata TaxID=143302 RepID=UPI00064331EA|nr:PREDICTED: protein phosphatase Slingshot homolog 3 [Condylura cristata]